MYHLRKRSKKRGYTSDLELKDLVIPEKCPIFGIRLEYGGKYKFNAPTVDRIDNSKGYTKDNIMIMSRAANQMKCDMPLEYWEKFKRRFEKDGK